MKYGRVDASGPDECPKVSTTAAVVLLLLLLCLCCYCHADLLRGSLAKALRLERCVVARAGAMSASLQAHRRCVLLVALVMYSVRTLPNYCVC
jgi:hypothetical protein